MDKYTEIANDIEQHTNKEKELNVRNPSVGRGYVTAGKKSTKVWIVNRPYVATSSPRTDIFGRTIAPEYTGIVDTYTKDGAYVPKNTKLGALLCTAYQGTYTLKTASGSIMTYALHNSCTYNRQGNHISDIKIGIEGQNVYYRFKNLNKLRNALAEKEESIRKNEAERLRLEEEQRKAEADRIQKEIEYQLALKKAQDEEAERQLQLQREREEAERLEEERKREEERLKLENEKEKLSAAFNKLNEKYQNAVSFIRQQASLRNQPILDKHQINIKFDSLFDGSTLVIDGGPGTGKTTTLIQRLKFLIEKESLEEYIKLTGQQAKVLFDEHKDWIFFSPTKSLCLYLRGNMGYEGLTYINEKTKVWKEFKQAIARDNYMIAGDDTPFKFAPLKYRRSELYNSKHHLIVKSFTNSYVESIKTKIQEVTEIDISGFTWKTIGGMIQKDCQNAKLEDLDSLIRFFNNLSSIRATKSINDNNDIEKITKNYSTRLKDVLLTLQAKLKREEDLYKDLLSFIREQQAFIKDDDNIEENDGDGDNDDVDIENDGEPAKDLEVVLNNKLRNLLSKLARRKYDKKAKLTANDTKLLKIVEPYIEEDKLEPIGQTAFFMRYFFPLLKGIEYNLLNPICQTYKKYRKEASKAPSIRWNGKLLQDIVKEGNRYIHPNELSLIIGFINNIALKCYQIFPTSFVEMKHKYIVAYRELCRPVIGVDEATDYTIMDYYAINSLRHYIISTITLSGDLMQCLEEKGITDWQDLSVVFYNLNIKQLYVSYRQSPKLMNVGVELYKSAMGKTPPYKCYLSETENIPSPIVYADDDEQSKADWIIERIIEVKKAYGTVPSIAIFFADKDSIPAFKNLMEDNGKLEESGIDIKDCSNGDTLTDQDTIRLFPINLIKGMEFEVVFFNNLDKLIENGLSTLIDKYLYVGLSRAAFYMGITISDSDNGALQNILPLFETDSNWSIIRNND